LSRKIAKNSLILVKINPGKSPSAKCVKKAFKVTYFSKGPLTNESAPFERQIQILTFSSPFFHAFYEQNSE